MNNNPLCPSCKNPVIIWFDYDYSNVRCETCNLSWGGETRVFKYIETKDGDISLTIDEDHTQITMPTIGHTYQQFEIDAQLPLDITEDRLMKLLIFS